MDAFGLYAQYYDLLYQDKDYTAEAMYIDKLIKQYSPSAKKILNLGCGTGKHDYILAQSGYNVTGVDIAPEMAAQAQKNMPPALKDKLSFLTDDIRTVKIDTLFDAVISLFHVMSYQVTNQDMHDAFNTAYDHLETGGLFIFDCWYGPGVLTDLPAVRVKRMSNNTINVTRLAEPVVNTLNNTVDVNYTILINKVNSVEVNEIKEAHKMRYLFVNEIELFVAEKFKLLQVYDWQKEVEPGPNTWNAVFILQKI